MSEAPDTTEAVAQGIARQDGVSEHAVGARTSPRTIRFDDAERYIEAHRKALSEAGWTEAPVKDVQKARVLDQVRQALWEMGEKNPEDETAIKIGDMISDGLLGLPIVLEGE